MKIELLRSWHAFQHAYFAAPRTKRGGRIPGVPAGMIGLVLRVMADIVGDVPRLPVGEDPCRVCGMLEMTL